MEDEKIRLLLVLSLNVKNRMIMIRNGTTKEIFF